MPRRPVFPYPAAIHAAAIDPLIMQSPPWPAPSQPAPSPPMVHPADFGTLCVPRRIMPDHKIAAKDDEDCGQGCALGLRLGRLIRRPSQASGDTISRLKDNGTFAATAYAWVSLPPWSARLLRTSFCAPRRAGCAAAVAPRSLSRSEKPAARSLACRSIVLWSLWSTFPCARC